MNHNPIARLEDEPHVEGGVHHPYTAFNQGWDAKEQGYPLSANPYGGTSREAHWWDMGWTDARDQEGRGPPDPSSAPLWWCPQQPGGGRWLT